MDVLPPWSRRAPLGLQHVLAVYAGALAVPLIVGVALVQSGKLQCGRDVRLGHRQRRVHRTLRTTGAGSPVHPDCPDHRDPRQLADRLRADGLSTVLGGVFNTFPYTAFAQNVGLVSLTGVRSFAKVRFTNTNVLVVAVSLGIGLLPTVSPTVYSGFPTWFQISSAQASRPVPWRPWS